MPLMSLMMITLELHCIPDPGQCCTNRDGHKSEEPTALANCWGIIPQKAHKTVQVITRTRIRTGLRPILSRWFRMNDHNLCYLCLPHQAFLDTMFVSTVSRRTNNCVQVKTTHFGWARVHPLTSKSDAHDTLLLLFARVSVLPACRCNHTNEMNQGKFYWNSRMLLVSWNSSNHIFPSQMPQKESVKSLRKGPIISCYCSRHQSTCEMAA